MPWTRRVVQFLSVVLLVLGLVTLGAQSISNVSVTLSEYGAFIMDSAEEVTLGNTGTWRAGSAITANGMTPDSAVTMSAASPPPLASTLIPRGDWYYRVDVSVNSQTPANTIFKVELHRWSATNNDYTLAGTLYVRSDADPAAGERARVYFGLGSTPSANETFMVIASRVS
jgi:hypothetical protein